MGPIGSKVIEVKVQIYVFFLLVTLKILSFFLFSSVYVLFEIVCVLFVFIAAIILLLRRDG